jgi:hypothetical protein
MQALRTKSIKIRLTEKEHRRLLSLCALPELARWMRETCLGVKSRADVPPPLVDPVLLRQLAGIGNNLNQIARVVNTKGQAIDRVHIVAGLAAIERQIALLRQDFSR